MERMAVAAETGTEVFHMALEMGMGTGTEIWILKNTKHYYIIVSISIRFWMGLWKCALNIIYDHTIINLNLMF